MLLDKDLSEVRILQDKVGQLAIREITLESLLDVLHICYHLDLWCEWTKSLPLLQLLLHHVLHWRSLKLHKLVV